MIEVHECNLNKKRPLSNASHGMHKKRYIWAEKSVFFFNWRPTRNQK